MGLQPDERMGITCERHSPELPRGLKLLTGIGGKLIIGAGHLIII
jgi:hypothetical protein